MERRRGKPLTAGLGRALSLALAVASGAAQAQSDRFDEGELMRGLREEVIWLPAQDGSRLQTTVFKPEGEGPFPLALISHGKSLGSAKDQPRDRFVALGREFLARGYAVASPMRRGFAGSEGVYSEKRCDTEANAAKQADDIEWALKALAKMPWVQAGAVALIGQSYGGIASIAAGSRGLPGVKGVINFAGGLKDSQCDWAASAERAFERFGAGALPSLWIYGENDSLFGPAEARAWSAAHNRGGGRSDLLVFGAFKNDAHELAGSVDGAEIWGAPVDLFLKRVGLPSGRRFELANPYGRRDGPRADLAAEDFKPGSASRKAYELFLSKPYPRAFAASAGGRWSWASDGDDPAGRALAACSKGASAADPCELVALDDVALRAKPLVEEGMEKSLAGKAVAEPQEIKREGSVGR